MAAGVPVIAAAAGGHLETIGMVPGARLFTPGNATGLADALRSLADDDARADLSRNVRTEALGRLSLAQHVVRLLEEYHLAGAAG
jgi:glycosyltransferase involved in cell wall biosynthesis